MMAATSLTAIFLTSTLVQETTSAFLPARSLPSPSLPPTATTATWRAHSGPDLQRCNRMFLGLTRNSFASEDENEAAVKPKGSLNDTDDKHPKHRDNDEFLVLRDQLNQIESLEDILKEIGGDDDAIFNDDDGDDDETELMMFALNDDDLQDLAVINDQSSDYEPDEVLLWDEDSLSELLEELLDSVPDDYEEVPFASPVRKVREQQNSSSNDRIRAAETSLEQALLQGVVPVSAGVGSECLVGDWGFDPLDLSTKDYFRQAQQFLLQLVPGGGGGASLQKSGEKISSRRPRALILRDYREAEIRHGRLAMLAAVIWPLQEMLDRLLLDEDLFGPLIYGPVTLPYFPLVMTAIMMLLGYLDVYSQAIKERDLIGEAFLPGDCFWDPLRMLEGAPDRMKRNMQERELFNGRVAMLAVAVFIWEESITHLPLIEIPGNEILLEPAYQVPFIQEWLDEQFADTISASVATLLVQ